MISNIAIPRTSDIPDSSFQLDPDKKKALSAFTQMLDTCPQGFPIQELKGEWFLTQVSRRMLHTVFIDIHEAIERLSAGKSISSRKSLFSLFQSDPVMRCFQFTVLDDSSSSPFEFSYFSIDSQRKSIIGTVSRSSSSQISLHLATVIDVPLRVVHSTATSLILSQTDTIPAPCENYLVLNRNYGSSDPGIDSILSSFGANSASNPMIKMVNCNTPKSSTQSSTKSIIKPASQVSEFTKSLFNKKFL